MRRWWVRNTLALAILIGTVGEISAVTIHNDRGGLVFEYAIKIARYRESGERVKILGRCDSACTMFLSLPNVCVGGRAVLGFHQASNPAGTRWLMSYYPPSIIEWIARQGGLPKTGVIVLKGRELHKRVRSC